MRTSPLAYVFFKILFPFCQCRRRLCFLRLFYVCPLRARPTLAHRTSLIAHRSSFIAPPPTPYGHKHTYGHIQCKYKLLFFFAHARRYVHIPLLHAKLPLQCDMNSQCAISCCGQACSRQLACRRQSDTGFSMLRAAGAQYYCTVVASLSDRRSRSHGAMACAFCVFFFYTTRLPSTVDLI